VPFTTIAFALAIPLYDSESAVETRVPRRIHPTLAPEEPRFVPAAFIIQFDDRSPTGPLQRREQPKPVVSAMTELPATASSDRCAEVDCLYQTAKLVKMLTFSHRPSNPIGL